MQTSDLDNVWTLIELLKEEGTEVTFAELAAKEEAMQWVNTPLI